VTAATEYELTETPVENFISFVRFLAENNLWDDAREALEAAGIGTIRVSTEPIRVIRKLINDDLLPNNRLGKAGHKHAVVIAECGCGVSMPGPPGHGPAFPTGGPTDAGTDATLPPDGGT
jgi:hypothetical protein